MDYPWSWSSRVKSEFVLSAFHQNFTNRTSWTGTVPLQSGGYARPALRLRARCVPCVEQPDEGSITESGESKSPTYPVWRTSAGLRETPAESSRGGCAVQSRGAPWTELVEKQRTNGRSTIGVRCKHKTPGDGPGSMPTLGRFCQGRICAFCAQWIHTK